MKAVLEFNLPEERQEHEAAVHGIDWAIVVWDLDVKLRNYLKYGNSFKSADEALESIRKELWEIIEDRGLNLEETIA